MLQNFLPPPDTVNVPQASSTATPPDREAIRILVIGSESGINATIHRLHQVGFAHIHEWSKLLPHTSGKLMRVLTRHILRQ